MNCARSWYKPEYRIRRYQKIRRDRKREKTLLNYPLDYAVWSILEEKACSKPHPNVESLKQALKKAWNEISLDTLVKIVDNFPKRLKACIDANGGHFE